MSNIDSVSNKIDKFLLFIPQLDQVDLSGTGDSKYQSKSSLKADANSEDDHGFHVVVAKSDESPAGQKWFKVWKQHSFSIIIIAITTFLLIYSIVAIAVRGFEAAQSLFGITMFLWFCMAYVFVRDHWGASIYKACMEPVVSAVQSRWRYLKWYAITSLDFCNRVPLPKFHLTRFNICVFNLHSLLSNVIMQC